MGPDSMNMYQTWLLKRYEKYTLRMQQYLLLSTIQQRIYSFVKSNLPRKENYPLFFIITMVLPNRKWGNIRWQAHRDSKRKLEIIHQHMLHIHKLYYGGDREAVQILPPGCKSWERRISCNSEQMSRNNNSFTIRTIILDCYIKTLLEIYCIHSAH